MLRRHLFVYFSATSVYALLSRKLAEAWSVKLSPVLRSAAGVTAFEPTALLAERVQNISIYTVYIDMFCTRSAKSAVSSKAVTPAAVPCESRVLWYFNFGSYIAKATFLTIIFLFLISCMGRILAAALHTRANSQARTHTHR